MKDHWDVTIVFKNGEKSEYIFFGTPSEARTDAYASFPRGDIANVIVKEHEKLWF